MILTEEEARKKWCPAYRSMRYVNVDGETHEADNRAYAFDENPRCIASECMMWKEGEDIKSLPVGIEPDGNGWKKSGPAQGIGGATTHRQDWKRKVGYCGLTRGTANVNSR